MLTKIKLKCNQIFKIRSYHYHKIYHIIGRPLLGSLVFTNFIVALDISKAFERVWHKSLLSKLPFFGFTPSICSPLLDFLLNRSISVIVNGPVSPPQPIANFIPHLYKRSFVNHIKPNSLICWRLTLRSSSKFPWNFSINSRLASRVSLMISVKNCQLESR